MTVRYCPLPAQVSAHEHPKSASWTHTFGAAAGNGRKVQRLRLLLGCMLLYILLDYTHTFGAAAGKGRKVQRLLLGCMQGAQGAPGGDLPTGV